MQGDLNLVYVQDDADGLFFDELFDLLEDSESVRDRLATGRFQKIDDPRFDAAPVESAKKAGYNIYYLKMWRRDGLLVPWRLIYAVHHKPGVTNLRILGLMPRSDNYEISSDFGRRVHADYDNNGIPRFDFG